MDIDGVLNSARYDREKEMGDGNIDCSRLSLLKNLTEETGARIVLSSTWRMHWDPTGKSSTPDGKALEALFSDAGVPLYDKTPFLGTSRAREIRAWLAAHKEAERFVILDDIKFGWEELDPYVIKTDYRIGYGLEEAHVRQAKEILNP